MNTNIELLISDFISNSNNIATSNHSADSSALRMFELYLNHVESRNNTNLTLFTNISSLLLHYIENQNRNRGTNTINRTNRSTDRFRFTPNLFNTDNSTNLQNTNNFTTPSRRRRRRENYSQRRIIERESDPLRRHRSWWNESSNSNNRTTFTNTPPLFTPQTFSFTDRNNRITRLINETLNIPAIPSPITRERLDQVTTPTLWSDISDTADQFICPITRERFIDSDNVLRINPCGHIFNQNALVTYLTEYDYRCPVCRFNLRDNNTNNTTTATNNTTTATDNTTTATDNTTTATNITSPLENSTNNSRNINPPPPISPVNTSLEFNPPVFNNTSTENSTTIPNAFTFGLSQNNELQNIMSSVVTELNNALQDPNNTNDTVTAEYSFFLPQNLTSLNGTMNNINTNTSTSTSTSTQTSYDNDDNTTNTDNEPEQPDT